MHHYPDEEKNNDHLNGITDFFNKPSTHYSLGAILVYGIFVGVLFWGAFHWAIELSNTQAFCVSCHEHRDNALPELQASRHYNNESGIRARCHDCHVPDEWAYKLGRKVYVTNELFHHLRGSISTPEKYEAKRLQMASYIWQSMKKSDSRECRNCHNFDYMDLKAQDGVAARQHRLAQEQKVTCIECHQGIAHKLPTGAPERHLLTEIPTEAKK
ncbi:Denitrification system component NirT [uncultured Gammaproteobacteria bacterium]